jgi:hypothetical protein
MARRTFFTDLLNPDRWATDTTLNTNKATALLRRASKGGGYTPRRSAGRSRNLKTGIVEASTAAP